MFKLSKWNLKDILRNQKESESLLKEIKKEVDYLESLRARLSPEISEKEFYSVLKRMEKVSVLSARVSNYGNLWFSADTKSQDAKVYEAKVQDTFTPLLNRILYLSLWWKHLDEKNAQRLMRNAGEYRYYLENIRKYRHYTLSEPEEKIINIKESTGADSLIDMYEMLKTSFKFPMELKPSGTKKMLTESELTKYVHDKNPKVREAAYDALLDKYQEFSDEFGFVYQTIVRDSKNEAIDLRKYKSPISVRNLSNDLPDEAIETLLGVCKKNTGLFQRYFKLKAKLLKMKKLSRCHIYAPVGTEGKKYSYDSAVNTVLDSYHRFSPEMEKLIRQVFDKNHIDSELRETKVSGAFCSSTTPDILPYVLVNYTGTTRDVGTLAHELGHAVHSMLASKHPIYTFHSVLPLAETASVFGEMLLTDKLLSEEDKSEVKLNILAQVLDETYATIIRQAFFVMFEKQAHDAIAKGATTDQLSAMWLKTLREQFGNAVEVPDKFKHEWLYIPHIFASPFYCYAYSFGNLLVLALYHKYKKEGQSFVPKYLRMLSHGGSRSPVDILRELNIDPTSDKFWQSGFDHIEEMVDEFEKLAKQK
jgi:oligoendopeptidase F